MAGEKILVVDDNPDNRDMLARRLRRRGYEAVPAEDGPTALLAMEIERFDMILLDVRMPGMSGLEVLEKIREKFLKTEMPVLMVTAETESSEVVRALKLGANDYVTKPIDFPVVLARVQAHLDMCAELSHTRTGPEVVIAATESLEPGFLLEGRYEIQSRLGEGGFATVYRAIQKSTGQHVAVKILNTSRINDPGKANIEIKRFEQEMKLIGSIQHPNIVRLIDSGHLRIAKSSEPEPQSTADMPPTRVVAKEELDGAELAPTPSTEPQPSTVPYLVMELLEGETLAELLARECQLDIQTAVDIMLPVIHAVHTAHLDGVIHRDLKPPNIFLHRGKQDQMQPRVLDFGIAKMTGNDVVDLTLTASVIGTPNYMSPEQALGKRDITQRSDQYTLASVLYECLTGKRPFEAESFIGVLHLVAKGEFVAPRVHSPDLPEELERIILKAMQPDPANRYDDLRSFGFDLLEFASASLRAQWAPIFTA